MQVSGAVKTEAEKDCQMFWRMARKLQDAVEAGGEIFEELDTLLALQAITDVPTVKRGCARLIERHGAKAEEQRSQIGART